jgi:hypothetical protein
MALYSTSMLEQDTVNCFLAHHDIRLDPRSTVKPPVDLRSSEHPTQSASEKTGRAANMKPGINGMPKKLKNPLDGREMSRYR